MAVVTMSLLLGDERGEEDKEASFDILNKPVLGMNRKDYNAIEGGRTEMGRLWSACTVVTRRPVRVAAHPPCKMLRKSALASSSY